MVVALSFIQCVWQGEGMGSITKLTLRVLYHIVPCAYLHLVFLSAHYLN